MDINMNTRLAGRSMGRTSSQICWILHKVLDCTSKQDIHILLGTNDNPSYLDYYMNRMLHTLNGLDIDFDVSKNPRRIRIKRFGDIVSTVFFGTDIERYRGYDKDRCTLTYII